MYAIIETGGKQYKVAEGEIIRVEKLFAENKEVEQGAKITIDKVLFIGGDGVKIGKPYVGGASVTAAVVENGKGKKVVVYKYKSKKNYHKKRGHRQPYTALKIESIKG